jgi:hypothetical protein
MTGWYIDFSLFNTIQLIHDFVYFSGYSPSYFQVLSPSLRTIPHS